MVTDANICNAATYSKIEESARHLEQAKEQCSGAFPMDAEIVLELPPPDEPDARCYYYCVSHEGQTLFWLNEMEIMWMLVEVKGLSDLSQASKILRLA
jgi:hypothetical protein